MIKFVDTMPFKYTYRIEEAAGRKRMIVCGPCQQIGVKNANNRVYPRSVWEKVIKENEERINRRRVFGELDHPDDGRTSLKRVSHIVTKHWIEGDMVMAEHEILDTPAGQILQAIIEANGEVGVSSRGAGSTKEVNGYQEVQDDYVWETYDFVVQPSVSIAYPKLKENAESNTEDIMSNIDQLKQIKNFVNSVKLTSETDLSALDDQLFNYEVALNKIMKEEELAEEAGKIKKSLVELRDKVRYKRLQENISKDELVKKLAAASALVEELVNRYKRDTNPEVLLDKAAVVVEKMIKEVTEMYKKKLKEKSDVESLVKSLKDKISELESANERLRAALDEAIKTKPEKTVEKEKSKPKPKVSEEGDLPLTEQIKNKQINIPAGKISPAQSLLKRLGWR